MFEYNNYKRNQEPQLLSVINNPYQLLYRVERNIRQQRHNVSIAFDPSYSLLRKV